MSRELLQQTLVTLEIDDAYPKLTEAIRARLAAVAGSTESVVIDGAIYDVHTNVACELLRLHLALASPEQPEDIGSEWLPCMKLPIVVHVREQRENEMHVSTREGITPVKPDDLIMRGVAGEEYPIGRDLFDRTYTLQIEQPASDEIKLPEFPEGFRPYPPSLVRAYTADEIHAYAIAAVELNRQPASNDSQHLNNLLARIHRDGGHYQGQHGTDKAVADADLIVARLYGSEDSSLHSSLRDKPVAWMNPYGGVVIERLSGLEKETFTLPLYLHPAPANQDARDGERLDFITGLSDPWHVQARKKHGEPIKYRMINDGEPWGKWHNTARAAIDAAIERAGGGA